MSFYGCNFFFFLSSAYTKTTSFWIERVQNGVVLNQHPKRRRLGYIQNDVVLASDSPKRRHFIFHLKINK